MSALHTMPAVGLDELIDRAALLTRVHRKYVLPRGRLEPVLQALAPPARVLEIDGARNFGYESTYYDDAALTSFHLAAHGRRRRFKVRTRTYAATGRQHLRGGQDPRDARYDRQAASAAVRDRERLRRPSRGGRGVRHRRTGRLRGARHRTGTCAAHHLQPQHPAASGLRGAHHRRQRAHLEPRRRRTPRPA
jgi:hypothetical protein